MTTAIITGGSRGFGLALAESLLTADWEVIVDGRDRPTLERAAARLGPRAHVVSGDVTEAEHRSELLALAQRLGGLHLLVNNASDLGPTPLPQLRRVSLEAFGELVRANVVAPLALIQLALPLLDETSGAVINVTSDAAVEAYEGWGAYGASKAALEQLSHVLAIEEPALRIWWLDPGDMRTDMQQAAFPGEDISDRPLPQTVAPAVLELLRRRPASGRIRARDLLGATPR